MDWPGSRSRAPAFPWDAQPRRAAVQRGAPDLSDDGKGATAAAPTAALALVPVQLGVGAFRVPAVPRVLPASAAAPAFFGHGGAAWSAGCGEASEGGSRLTARSVFGFPSASEGCAASVSVSHSCAAFGDDGAEVDSGAAHGETQHAAPSQAAPLALLGDRAPPGFFAQLGPPPGLEMYYGAGGVARQDHMAVDLAALVPYAPASRKRAAEDDWQPVERPARVFRSVYDTAADQHMDPAFDQLGVTSTIVTHEELVMDTAPDWSYLAHLSARERQMLPASAETAHDTLLPYDAEMHPLRRDHENEE